MESFSFLCGARLYGARNNVVPATTDSIVSVRSLTTYSIVISSLVGLFKKLVSLIAQQSNRIMSDFGKYIPYDVTQKRIFCTDIRIPRHTSTKYTGPERSFHLTLVVSDWEDFYIRV